MPRSHLAEEKVKVEVAALPAQSCGVARQSTAQAGHCEFGPEILLGGGGRTIQGWNVT